MKETAQVGETFFGMLSCYQQDAVSIFITISKDRNQMNTCSGWNLISDGLLQLAKLKHIVIIYDFNTALPSYSSISDNFGM